MSESSHKQSLDQNGSKDCIRVEKSSQANIAFITLGCAKNEVDSGNMADLLQEAGYQITDEPEKADLVIVNTCSFIQAATEESIDAILEASNLSRIKAGEAKLIVSGCMPARYKDELEDSLPEVDDFVPCKEELDIVARVNAVLECKNDDLACEKANNISLQSNNQASQAQKKAHEKRAISPLEDQSITQEQHSHKQVFAYVKISDGCDRFCSYCTIPYIRGRYHSFSMEEIKAKVSKHAAAGVKEIVLIAQDTGRWGDDFNEASSLAQLLRELAQSFPNLWFRLMYIQPEGINDELISTVAAFPNICNYFDIPFQSANSTVLKNMNRSGSAAEYLALIEHIRSCIPDVTLRTTLIAGFPGETDEQFEETCDFLQEAELDYVGVFPYSQEDGTRAAEFTPQIDEDTKLARFQELRDIADTVSASVISGRIGKSYDVLVCGEEEDGQLFGRTQAQAPEVDGLTYIHKGSIGEIISCTIEDTLLYEMEGV